MTDVRDSYTALVSEVRELILQTQRLGAALIPATAAQYEAPPGTVAAKGKTGEMTGISNPTLDTVLDGRRMGLSEEVTRTSQTLSRVASDLSARTAALRAATDRWEGLDPVADEGVLSTA